MKHYSVEDVAFILNEVGPSVRYTQLSEYNDVTGGIMIRLLNAGKTKHYDLFVSISKENAEILENLVNSYEPD